MEVIFVICGFVIFILGIIFDSIFMFGIGLLLLLVGFIIGEANDNKNNGTEDSDSDSDSDA